MPYARIGPLIGAAALGMTVYELPRARASAPTTTSIRSEEWLIVLEGTPTLRDPDGETVLDAGRPRLLPARPRGAHKVTNRAAETSPRRDALDEGEDRGRRLSRQRQDRRLVGRRRRSAALPELAAVDYWHGEL